MEKKVEEADKPKKVDKGALAKKIQAQLHGIDLLEKLTCDLVKLGIGNMNAKTASEIEEQAKQLGNAYLTGAQSALHNYTKLFASEDGQFDGVRPNSQRESVFSEALDQLGRLHSLVKQGRAYLQRRLEDPDLAPETDSGIAAWLGHAWQLRELKDAGLVETGAELVQLAFNSHDDVARREFVDTGDLDDAWQRPDSNNPKLSALQSGEIHQERRQRFSRRSSCELCVYPGDVNPRIRWDAMLPRAIESKDLHTVRSHGHGDIAAVVKEVKVHLKGPLADKQPICALNYKRIGQVNGTLVVEDSKGERLVLTDAGMTEEPASCHLLSLLPRECFADQTLIVRFRHDLDTRQLQVKPLSIVTSTGIVRLTL